MCFSATASFTAGTTLSVIGVASLKPVKTKSERPFALIPLLFGIQQLSEGGIWLTFGHGAPALGSFIAAYMVYVGALVSIWCFFAAVLSLLVYFHFRFGTFGGSPKAKARLSGVLGTP